MKFPAIPFLKKQVKFEYFLALLLRDDKVSAFVFEEHEGRIQIIGEGNEHFEGSIEDTSFEKLLHTLDKAISAAEQSLPENIETQKTVFGLKDTWILEGKIKKEYLHTLKKICDTLGLSPIGFLTITEAIVHALQKEEGVPVSAILVEAGKTLLTVSIVRGGKIIESKQTHYNHSIAESIETLLKEFTSFEVLPSRIIIFGSTTRDKTRELVQKCIAHPWNKSLPFLHVPKVIGLPSGFDARALLIGTATQMGFEILGQELQETIPHPQTKEIHKQVDTTDGRVMNETMLEEFGFVREKDIASFKHAEELNAKESHEKAEQEIQDTKDGKEMEDKQYIEEKPITHAQRNNANFLVQYIKSLQTGALSKNILRKIPNIKSLRLPIIPSMRNMPTGKMLVIPSLIVVGILGIVLSYIFLLSATITLSIKPKIASFDQDISVVKDAPTDISTNTIQGKPVSSQKDGTATVQSTGKKEVGEKAKGTITIYNSDLSDGVVLQKGTTIKAADLEFTLDDSATIASASGDASSIKASTGKVSITASDIGKEYNMPSNTKFTVGTYPQAQVIAKNESAFSGGSKKEVKVVSKNDIDKLTAQLPKTLESKAREEIQKKITSNNILIATSIEQTFTKKDFSKKPNDEADSVTLKGVVSYDGLFYSRSDIGRFSQSFLEKRIPHDLSFSDKGLKLELKNVVKQKDASIKGTLHIQAPLVPKLDTEKLNEQVTGKSFSDAKDILSRVPQVSDIDFSLSPSLPFLPERLPMVRNRIKIIIQTNE